VWTRPLGTQIRLQDLRFLGVRVYAIGVDKNVFSLEEGRNSAAFRPHETAAKTLASVSGFCKSGILTPPLLQS